MPIAIISGFLNDLEHNLGTEKTNGKILIGFMKNQESKVLVLIRRVK